MALRDKNLNFVYFFKNFGSVWYHRFRFYTILKGLYLRRRQDFWKLLEFSYALENIEKKRKLEIFFADFLNNRIGTAAVTVDPNMDQFLAEKNIILQFLISILILKGILYNEIS